MKLYSPIAPSECVLCWCWQPHLDPLVWADVVERDAGLRSVQQNLELGAGGILAGTDTYRDHPAGAVLTCPTDKGGSQ